MLGCSGARILSETTGFLADCSSRFAMCCPLILIFCLLAVQPTEKCYRLSRASAALSSAVGRTTLCKWTAALPSVEVSSL